jgi:pimeloyl-ACP methyl ester carboxylesterase
MKILDDEVGEALRLPGANGITLAAGAWGPADGAPVLLLHGGGQTRHSWQRTGIALGRERFRAYAVDLRGHGDSDRAPDGGAGYDLDCFAADVRALAAAVGDRPALVGASLGGLAALLATGENPRVDARLLTLVDVAPRTRREGRERIGAFMAGSPGGFASLTEAADAVARYLPERPRPRSTDGLRRNLRQGDDGRWRWHWDPAFLESPLQRQADAPDRLERAALAVRCPIVLVRGGTSDVVTQAEAAAFRALLPEARSIDIADAGHMVAGDANDAFTDAVLAELAEHR